MGKIGNNPMEILSENLGAKCHQKITIPPSSNPSNIQWKLDYQISLKVYANNLELDKFISWNRSILLGFKFSIQILMQIG